MTDHIEDEPELKPQLLDAARAHNVPPIAPREEMWARIEAARRQDGKKATRMLSWRKELWIPAAIAATLVIGFAIGRTTQNGSGLANNDSTAVPREDLYAKYATAQTLGQAEVLLVQYRAATAEGTTPITSPAEARRLLLATRLLLDAPSITDPQLRILLEDLELILAQIAEDPEYQEDRALITEGLDRGGVLPRLRAVMPNDPQLPLQGAL
jgi:hypothetical protein